MMQGRTQPPPYAVDIPVAKIGCLPPIQPDCPVNAPVWEMLFNAEGDEEYRFVVLFDLLDAGIAEVVVVVVRNQYDIEKLEACFQLDIPGWPEKSIILSDALPFTFAKLFGGWVKHILQSI